MSRNRIKFYSLSLAILVFLAVKNVGADESSPTKASMIRSPYVKLEKFSADKSQAFTKESTTVVVTADLALDLENKPIPGQKAPPLVLLEVDQNRNRTRYLGVLSDDGVMGDKKAGDGRYSRKIQMYSKKGELKYLAVAEEVNGKIPDQVALDQPLLEFEIIYRPSFVELIERVWSQIWSDDETSAENGQPA